MYISGSKTILMLLNLFNNSNTFKLIEEDNVYLNGERFKSRFFSKDNFYFKNNNNKETKVKNLIYI